MVSCWVPGQAISLAIGQRYTKRVTEDGGIAMGHFGSLGYYLSARIAAKVGKAENSFADTEISPKNGASCAIPQ